MTQPPKPCGTKRILLVDDSPDDLAYLREALAPLGNFSFSECTNAMDAVALARREAFDCLLVDYNMPGESGLDVVRELTTDGIAAVPVVMLTGQGAEEVAVRALHAGAYDYLSKNTATPEDIARAIERACEHFALACWARQQHAQTAHALRLRDEMLSVISHELRTPTSVLLLNLQSMLQKVDAASDVATLKPKLQRAIASVARINRLTERLLDVSRFDQATPKLHCRATNVTHLVRDTVARFTEYGATEGCDLHVHAEAHVVADVDADRLEQVLTNLLSNAIKYGQHRPVHIDLSTRDDDLILQVRDQGVGVAEQDRTRIFERFERATRVGEKKSLGLGLFLSREIVEAHHGTVHVESGAHGGSTFVVCLPRQAH